jgi:hypothetical protein
MLNNNLEGIHLISVENFIKSRGVNLTYGKMTPLILDQRWNRFGFLTTDIGTGFISDEGTSATNDVQAKFVNF